MRCKKEKTGTKGKMESHVTKNLANQPVGLPKGVTKGMGALYPRIAEVAMPPVIFLRKRGVSE